MSNNINQDSDTNFSASTPKRSEQTHLDTQIVDQCNIVMCIVSLLSKIISIVYYVLLRVLTDCYLTTFIGILLIVSIDFWIIKNIFGIKLIGLKWWYNIDRNGQQKWMHKQCTYNRELNTINQLSFWIPLILFMLFWLVSCIISIVTFNMFWFILQGFSLLLSLINIYNFLQCKGTHQRIFIAIQNKIGLNIIQQTI